MYARNKSLAETHNFVLTEEELAKKFSKTKDGEALRELPSKELGLENSEKIVLICTSRFSIPQIKMN